MLTAPAFERFGSVEFSDKARSYLGKLRGFFFYYAKLAVSGALNNPYAVEVAPLFEGAVGPKNWLHRMPSKKCGSYSSMCAVVFFASAVGGSCYSLDNFQEGEKRLMEMDDLQNQSTLRVEINGIAFVDGEVVEF
jgi:hypothetical protein